MNLAGIRLNEHRQLFSRIWLFAIIGCFWIFNASSQVAEASASCDGAPYLVGAARGDITGPIVGVGMMGYADLGQIDEGLHTRLWSRSIVVSDPCSGSTIALVIGDLAMVFHGLKQAVLDRLDRELPGVFTHANLMFSATHTHAGPGGFAHNTLYNITTYGFNPENFEAIVAGTARAVVKAYKQRQEASLSVSSGHLRGYQFNRSPEAFDANPEADRATLPDMADTEMFLVKATASNGTPIAAFNWYPVHGVSLPLNNKLVSGDNKGLASLYFERQMGATYRKDQEFVAGFMQANAGDISPHDVTHGPLPKTDGFERNEWSARGQFNKAWQIFQSPIAEELRGSVAYSHRFEKLAYRKVSPEFTDGEAEATTCNAVLGESFAAGTLNGQPFPIFVSHAIYGKTWPKITLMPKEQRCHQEKVLLLPTGFAKPNPWTASVAPFQLLRIGPLVVIGAPFEITTVAGHRLKAEIKRRMADVGVRFVVLSGLTNEYLHYVTTREEYKIQAYEGGSTLYGPWSLAAYTEIFADLAIDMSTGRQRPAGAPPPDLSQKQVVLPHPVLFDLAPRGGKFGDVLVDSKSEYRFGELAAVEIWGAHPNNSLAPGVSYLTIERRQDEKWKTIFFDWDGQTTLHWRRHGIASSVLKITWGIPMDAPAGLYRICQHGKSKAPLTGKLSPYSGCSRGFKVGS